jgi:hypothetical protein
MIATSTGQAYWPLPTQLPKLPSTETFYFVVRARDGAGNEDSNTVEREGLNLCV